MNKKETNHTIYSMKRLEFVHKYLVDISWMLILNITFQKEYPNSDNNELQQQ